MIAVLLRYKNPDFIHKSVYGLYNCILFFVHFAYYLSHITVISITYSWHTICNDDCMNLKKLIRIIKHKLSPKDVTFDNGLFDAIDLKLILDKDICVTIASYDERREVFIILVKPLKLKEC